MRVSTSLAFERSIQAMNDRQTKLIRTQDELSTGRKLLRPSDDPVAAAEAERARSQMRRTELQQRMTGFARDMLNSAEATLSQVTELMQSSREMLVQAGNGSLSAEDRSMMATQLQGFRDELLTLANRRDGSGAHMFGGQGSLVAPFVDDGAAVTYQAAPGQQEVGLDGTAPTSLDGREGFMSVSTPGGNRSMFAVLDDAIAALGDPSATPAAVTAAVKAGLDGVDSGLDKLLTQRTAVGEHLRALDSRDDMAESQVEALNAKLADILYVDYAKAISDSAANQSGLQAAMKTYSEISKLSLFQYI